MKTQQFAYLQEILGSGEYFGFLSSKIVIFVILSAKILHRNKNDIDFEFP